MLANRCADNSTARVVQLLRSCNKHHSAMHAVVITLKGARSPVDKPVKPCSCHRLVAGSASSHLAVPVHGGVESSARASFGMLNRKTGGPAEAWIRRELLHVLHAKGKVARQQTEADTIYVRFHTAMLADCTCR